MIFNPARLKFLHGQLRQNHQTAFVLSEEQIVELAKANGLSVAKFWGGNAATALDLKTLTKLLQELGFTGRVIQKRVSGKTYIIFKGSPGLRSIFMGTRYLASNGKVMDMAIGSAALKNSVLSGFRLTLFFTVPLIVVEHLFKDKMLLSELFAVLAATLIKVGIASIFSAAAGVAMGTITTVAAAPLAIAIFVGLVANWALDKLDGHYGLTKRLAEVLREFDGATLGKLRSGMWQIEKTLRWQIINRQSVGKGIYY